MKVTLTANWFAPSEEHKPDKQRVFSGVLYRKGVHYMDKAMFPHLPKSAKVEDGPTETLSKADDEAWRNKADQNRAALEAASEWHAQADAELAKRKANTEKAREAKRLKRLVREAEAAATKE